MTEAPFISVIVCVCNGMPYVREAVESIREQSYQNYEVVVQDGASTDGTLEYLESVEGFRRWSLVSAPDTGIGQGFNRAVQRCHGDIVATVDADNRLNRDALSTAVARFAEHPDAAVVYGGSNMITPDGDFIHAWTPPAFDLLGLIEGAVVPPFAAAFFSSSRCAPELRFDESMVTVADFDLWLRLADREIVRVFDVFGDVRIGPQSSTWNSGSYDNQSKYKLLALERFARGSGCQLLIDAILARARAGLYLWTVDSLSSIGGDRDKMNHYFAQIAGVDIKSERFRAVVSRALPVMPTTNSAFGESVFDCGQEFLIKGRPAEALVYFELLERSDMSFPDLASLIDRCRTEHEAVLRGQCHHLIQQVIAEVALRDEMLAEKDQRLAMELQQRETMLEKLRERLRFFRPGEDD